MAVTQRNTRYCLMRMKKSSRQMTIIKEKRQKAFLALEEEKQQNLRRKKLSSNRLRRWLLLLKRLTRTLTSSRSQHWEWKRNQDGSLLRRLTNFWRNYQLYVEQFYDLLNLNREAREYDKKNLEKKTKLCEAAEKLAEETDVISAFHQLQGTSSRISWDRSCC